jgi:prepilin-type N-terminal cleavage/methylation domain-containing protein
MKMNLKKGFTLIELLVVVAIIGILASVVLASLNTARTKGSDAAIKAAMSNARAQAELFYDSGATYLNVCAASTRS